MHSHRTLTHDIAAHTEAGDLVGWCDDAEARDLIRVRRARVLCNRPGRSRIEMVASVDIPLSGASKQRAIAGYVGAVKYTYREELVSGKLHMLKRAMPNGQFVAWPKESGTIPSPW